MSLRYRPMQPADIRECVDLLANHPVIGPRYGPWMERVPEAWLRLLQSEAVQSAVIRDGESPRAPICLLGGSAIVTDDFVREWKTPPHFWIGPEITRRMVSGESPVLTGKQLREANSYGGLNLVCWESCVRPGYEQHGELQRGMMTGFIQQHKGYRWKELISAQSASAEHLVFVIKTGGFLWDPIAGSYAKVLNQDPAEIVSQPHVIGVTRELELNHRGSWAGNWVGALFDYHPPVLGFSRSEQRLLWSALSGSTDEHLAGALGISLPAVKNMWASIYRRVEDCMPELIPDRPDGSENGRGREKRRVLLAYLREHLEELRPFSRKLLAKAAHQ